MSEKNQATPRDTRDEVIKLLALAVTRENMKDMRTFVRKALALLRAPETQERGWQGGKPSK